MNNFIPYLSLHSLVIASVLAAFIAGPAFALEPHREIKGLFRDGRDVTVKCLECHKKEAEEVLQSSHWSWKRQRNINGKEMLFGKKDSLSGFGIDVGTNPGRCMSCHVSNTPQEVNFDDPGPDMVDCLVCHDTTKTYRSRADNSRVQDNIDFLFLARNVGLPTTGNCTTCHFAECGLTQSVRSIAIDQADIHMSSTGTGFTCQACHLNKSGHTLTRKTAPQNSSTGTAPEGCISCHSGSPHSIDSLNRHTATVSCQSCHIPEYAIDKPAMVGWNWLMTGKANVMRQNSPDGQFRIHDQNGMWTAMNLEPVYLWDDGSDTVYSRGQRIKPQELTYLQKPASRNDRSRITPFRVTYATQLYDTKYRYLVSPLLYPQGEVLFPGSEWDTIARDGMKAIILPYSEQHGFAPTVSYKRINHGVVPAEKALDCLDCHGRSGRMNWQMLGFEEDPMAKPQALNRSDGLSSREQSGSGIEPLPPVQESVIPSSSGF